MTANATADYRGVIFYSLPRRRRLVFSSLTPEEKAKKCDQRTKSVADGMESTEGGMESSQSDVWNPHFCGMESDAVGMKEKSLHIRLSHILSAR